MQSNVFLPLENYNNLDHNPNRRYEFSCWLDGIFIPSLLLVEHSDSSVSIWIVVLDNQFCDINFKYLQYFQGVVQIGLQWLSQKGPNITVISVTKETRKRTKSNFNHRYCQEIIGTRPKDDVPSHFSLFSPRLQSNMVLIMKNAAIIWW